MLKIEAGNEEDEERKKMLLGAAKMLADATGKMVEAARVSDLLGLFLFWNIRSSTGDAVETELEVMLVEDISP